MMARCKGSMTIAMNRCMARAKGRQMHERVVKATIL